MPREQRVMGWNPTQGSFKREKELPWVFRGGEIGGQGVLGAGGGPKCLHGGAQPP